MEEVQFTSVGPIIGQLNFAKGVDRYCFGSVCIILFIAFAFRGVSRPVASWKYGIVAIITAPRRACTSRPLCSTRALYGCRGRLALYCGLLTILGISINDTIVVFDRIRENLRLNEEHHKREGFDEVVGRSIMQTLARSINTSLTVVIVLVSLYFLGPASTKTFALTLIVGMVAGTYSSIFLASPLLVVVWERLQRKS
jgi:preprotein translocase subunit SecF